jgi:hypothetical protein
VRARRRGKRAGRPLNWQITFDGRQACFVALWTDTLGPWAVRTSPGWEDDRIAFTGATVVDGQPGLVRDTLTRRSGDELLFVVEFQVDGAWRRFLESGIHLPPPLTAGACRAVTAIHGSRPRWAGRACPGPESSRRPAYDRRRANGRDGPRPGPARQESAMRPSRALARAWRRP